MFLLLAYLKSSVLLTYQNNRIFTVNFIYVYTMTVELKIVKANCSCIVSFIQLYAMQFQFPILAHYKLSLNFILLNVY